MAKPTGIEKRSFEIRAAQDDDFVLEGYAALFNKASKDLGGFVEFIAPGAFDRSLKAGAEVKATFNHSLDKLLARTKNGSLQLACDDRGLKFRAQLDEDNPLHQEIFSAVKSGLIDECSFAFIPTKQDWSADGTKRTVLDCDLFDVSVVACPAYNGTTVDARAAGTGPNADGLARLAQIDADYERNCKANRLRAELASGGTTTTPAEPTHAELKAKAEQLAKQHRL